VIKLIAENLLRFDFNNIDVTLEQEGKFIYCVIALPPGKTIDSFY